MPGGTAACRNPPFPSRNEEPARRPSTEIECGSPTMKTLEQNLTQYAAYHRDRRNIATHFAGVPMIVFAIVLALATAVVSVGPVAITMSAVLSIPACVYYFRLDLTFGLTMALVLFAMCAGASEITARLATGATLWLAPPLFPRGRAAGFPRPQ